MTELKGSPDSQCQLEQGNSKAIIYLILTITKVRTSNLNNLMDYKVIAKVNQFGWILHIDPINDLIKELIP